MLPNSHPIKRIGFFIGGNMKKLVYGVGINDADYAVQFYADGRKLFCPFYQKWQSMIARCYSEKLHNRQPTYKGCSVCDEWLIFSNFKSWMITQDWQGKQLDKDIISVGNKVYSPEMCAFVDHATNSFVTCNDKNRGKWPLGVHFDSGRGKFMAKCCNPITGKDENLGRYSCPDYAHKVWKARKHQLACQLAELQNDDRVSSALRTRYL